MAGEKSLQSAFPPIAHQGGGERGEKEKKTENERTNQARRPTCPAAAPSLARSAREGTGGELEPSPRALTSVSALDTARSASSELRAAVPGPGSRRAACIAAAASGQPPGVLHAEGRVGLGRRSPRSSRGSGARAWTAPPVAGRTLGSARLASVPQSGGSCGRSNPSPACCYLIPGWARPRSPTPRRPAPPRPLRPLALSYGSPGGGGRGKARRRRGEWNGGRGGGRRLRLGALPAPRPAVTRIQLGNNSNSQPRALPLCAAPPPPPPTRPRPDRASLAPAPLHTQTHHQPLAHWSARASVHTRAHTHTHTHRRRHVLPGTHTGAWRRHTQPSTRAQASGSTHAECML